ncbi:hypothetical protein [Sphingomonas rubra]|uniref:Uncharacterized protein n=1 Tax=Sphingomonas rubra TaxID=634430 RepID=A0A1I5QV82_9SPHN|nr:hypothetical protein [Sphingomonas rubra]SFP49941.1 hypothetical protein SAMN04488241_102297 [Sphingomonas rubra]
MGLMGSKPFASLSSGLLARKGQARPAMRPQMLGPAASLDDLGWNDMGYEATTPSSPPVAPEPAPLPPVLVEREALIAQVARPATPPAPDAVAPAVLAQIGRESGAQTARGKAAFTLRLDAGRHLRLRLATVVAKRSAQALVAEALDRFLDTVPEVEALAAQLPAPEVK